jgi:TonB family protein
MSKERNHHDFPDRETLLEYLKGGLSFRERHRIEKLMLEHEFFREVVEGLESEDPELIEDDLAALSMSIRHRAGLQNQSGFNIYSMAATISLIILASVIIFVAIDRFTTTERNGELSMHKPAGSEMEDNGKIPNISRSVPVTDSAAEKQENMRDEEDEKSPQVIASQNKEEERSSVKDEPEKQEETEKSDRQKFAEDLEAIPLQEPEQAEEPVTMITQHAKNLQNAESLQESDIRARSQQPKRSEPSAAAVPFADEEEISGAMEDKTSPGLTINYMTALNLPQPVDGFEQYEQYLSDSLRYPQPALNRKVEGIVIISFTVGNDSIPRQLSVINSLGSGCDEEALRLIREGPMWKPAISGGKFVESEMKIPVRFRLPKGGR